ncbi:energy-coupling factor ABC transporter ATP-binding protein [Mycoplasmoides pneumoniae]|uniref:energy-coupling factor ABC transporter ATP-binding protein n=1 Tax=Mycoplasmoides pneumoniae TaxID=2104 RepID=UPI0019114414|nr:energy-coupling factor ABC transporter ATP-binding protein [Mycoplasmoides pneumoniae]
MQTPQIIWSLIAPQYRGLANKVNRKLIQSSIKHYFWYCKQFDKLVHPFYYLTAKKHTPLFNQQLVDLAQSTLYFYNLSVFVDKSNAGQIIKNVTGSVEPNQITVIFGPSGSGKTTLIKQLGLVENPTCGFLNCGNFYYFANQKHNRATKQFQNSIGYVLQKAEEQFFCDSVLEEVLTGAINLGLCQKGDVNFAKKYLEMCGLDHIPLIKNPLELSGGQKKRLALASVLAMQVQFLILDEPTVGLDQEGKALKSALLKQLKQVTRIIIVSHDVDFIYETADSLIQLEAGQIVDQMSVADFFNNMQLLQRYEITPPLVVQTIQLLQAKGVQLNDPLAIKTVHDLIDQLKPLFHDQ